MKKLSYAEHVNRLDRIQYLAHWIIYLVSRKTKWDNTFYSWMDGCEDRYTEQELMMMAVWWQQ